MGRLVQLELCNFKSFGGHVVLGPFKNFTAIIGTNGSGKSNILDAVSFALGLRAAQIRGNQLRDLVFRNPDDPHDNPAQRKCHVKLEYLHNGETTTFQRSVLLSGTSEFRVNDAVVSMDKYIEALGACSIHVKARYSLVLQHQVDEIALKSPKELTAMFEDISQSGQLRQEYDAARAEKDALEDTVTKLWSKRKQIAVERRLYREQKMEADKFLELQATLNKRKEELAMYRLFHMDQDLQDSKCQVEQKAAELRTVQEALSDKETSMHELGTEIKDAEREKTKQEIKQRRLTAELEKIQTLEIKHETELNTLQRRIKGDELKLRKVETENERSSATVQALEEKLLEVSAELNTVQEQLRSCAMTQSSPSRGHRKSAASILVLGDRNVFRNQLETINKRISDYKQKVLIHQNRVQELSATKSEVVAELNRLEQNHSRSLEHENAHDNSYAQLQKIVNETKQALLDADSESEDVRHTNRLVDVLRGAGLRGIKGTLSQLCKPTQDRYRVAVEIIFGKLKDAIVVDNKQTASECIKYLKENRVGAETFIPLADIRPRPIDAILRDIGGTSRLIIDVVSHEEQYTPAVLYAAGNSVVCDTLEEARAVRYDRGHRVKVCSLDGTVINVAGFMTGGSMGELRRGGPSSAELEALRKKNEAALAKLREMGSITDRRLGMERLQKIAEVRRNRHCVEQDLALARTNLEQALKDTSEAEKELDELNDAHPSEAAIQPDPASSEDRSIREDEETLIAKKLDLETRHAKLSSQIMYEKSKDHEMSIPVLTRKINEQARRLNDCEKDLENVRSRRSEMEKRASELKDTITSLVQRITTSKDAMKELRVQIQQDKSTVIEKQTALSQVEELSRQVAERREQLRTDCDINNLFGCEESIDYSSLAARLRDRTANHKKLQSELSDGINQVQSELGNLVPNMRANEHLAEVSIRLEAADRESDAARESAKTAREKFEKIQEERQKRFSECFSHISGNISSVYERLTACENYPRGGTSQLSLDRQDETYLGGIRFSAMPPTKRFRDMELLSGGERTLASLALLFAINMYKPSPFFILDEVDAALDAQNVRSVSSFLKSRSQETQTIVITHKPALFERVDALIGVYRDTARNASGLITLDLTRFTDSEERSASSDAPSFSQLC